MEAAILLSNYRRNKKSNKFATWVRKNWAQIIIILVVLMFAIMVLLPLAILLIRSFKVPEDDFADPFGIPTRFTLENYSTIWEYIKTAYLNSFITTIGVTGGVVIITSLLAYAFIRFNFPLKDIMFYAIISLMMVPGILTLITRYQECVDMGLLNTLTGIIVPGIAGYIPGAFMLLFTFFRGIPKELMEAMDIDEANNFTIYTRLVLPLSKPILWTIGIQTFIGEWNDFLWAKLMLTNDDIMTLPITLQSLTTAFGQMGMLAVAFAGYVLSALPLIVIFICASKQFVAGLTSGAFKM